MAKRRESMGVFNLYLWYSLIICLNLNYVSCDNDGSEEFDDQVEEEIIEVIYKTPSAPPNSYLFESFDDEEAFENKWIKSEAKKEDVDEDIAKYNGLWAIEPLEKDALKEDYGLVFKSKAKHAAISAKLNKPFIFKDKPFVVQYEVNLQDGQECGGAYIKLLSDSKENSNLKVFNDRTPYTIMFGPDKCGNEHKLHFIFRHVNPITKAVEEKHCKRPKDKLEAPFKDKRTHLYTLILRPDNTFEILFDHEVINSGHLLEDFNPPVNPPKEIDDPKDVKPSDWDEREKIPDPNAKKPEDWDEDAPKQIIDQFAVMPEGWLEDENELIPEPGAVKPDDWDDEMDGEWEAPLVPNPVCESAPGCGKWKPPVIDNPAYKGKWKPPMIDNPNYRGKWAPRKIPNPDFFEDLEPFKMIPISAVGLELWSMSDRIYFDNFLITDKVEESRQLAAETFDLKITKLEKGQKGFFAQLIEFSNEHPWIYGVYVLILAIPVVLIFVCCCAEDVKEDKQALRKKTDEPTEDDDAVVKDREAAEDDEEEEEEEEGEAEGGEVEGEGDGDGDGNGNGNGNVDGDEAEEKETEPETKSESEVEKSDDDTKKSPRLRKVRKD